MSDARIVDRGYRPYDGPRLGAPGAIRSLVRHTAWRVLGIRRNARTKVLPALSAGIAYVPAVVFVGIAAFIPDDRLRDDVLPSYGEYYGFVTMAIVVFAAFVAPEALCPDRRSGMLGLYLASPLTRDTYLLAKGVAVGGLLALTTLGPPLLLLLANTLQGVGPDDPLDVLTTLARVVAAGFMLAAFFTVLSLVASSLTDRRAVASAGVVLVLLVSAVVANVLVEEMDAPGWVLAFDLFDTPFELAGRIFGERGEVPEVSTAALATSAAVVIGLGSLFVRTRYQRLAVVS